MEFYNVVLLEFQNIVNVTTDPRHIAFDECVRVLEESKFGMSFEEYATLFLYLPAYAAVCPISRKVCPSTFQKTLFLCFLVVTLKLAFLSL
jgi:hypothetical protein